MKAQVFKKLAFAVVVTMLLFSNAVRPETAFDYKT